MNNAYTENLADFGVRERKIAAKLLAAELPKGFYDSGVKLAFNRNSGFVFLVNDDYQCAMMNGENMELYHSTPYDGLEGFLSELVSDYRPSDMLEEDAEYIRDAAKTEGLELPPEWLQSNA